MKFVPFSKQSNPKKQLDDNEESMQEENDDLTENGDLSDDMSDILPGLFWHLIWKYSKMKIEIH